MQVLFYHKSDKTHQIKIKLSLIILTLNFYKFLNDNSVPFSKVIKYMEKNSKEVTLT